MSDTATPFLVSLDTGDYGTKPGTNAGEQVT